MTFCFEHLAAFAVLHQALYCLVSSLPVETMTESFTDDCLRRCVMTAFTLMYVPEELNTSVLFYASLEDACCTLAHQLIVDNRVCSGSPTDLPCFSVVSWKDSIHQEISNRLCP